MKNKKINFKNERGTSLVEVLLSVALLGIIVVPLMGAVVSSVQTNTAAKDKTEAIALAEKVMGEIKAWKVITETTPPVDLTPSASGLVPCYEITLEDTGNVAPSVDTTYTYGIPTADKFDFELIINQGESTDGKVDVKLKIFNKNIIGESTIKIDSDLLVAEEGLVLTLDKDLSGNYSYYIDQKSVVTGIITDIEEDFFHPRDTTNPKNIKLKVTYAENTIPSSAEQLKIFTYIDSALIDFQVYSLNIDETNSGVSFINKGTTNFEVNYVDTKAFNYNATNPPNSLYKINVTINKGTKEIYKTSSYAKK